MLIAMLNSSNVNPLVLKGAFYVTSFDPSLPIQTDSSKLNGAWRLKIVVIEDMVNETNDILVHCSVHCNCFGK